MVEERRVTFVPGDGTLVPFALNAEIDQVAVEPGDCPEMASELIDGPVSPPCWVPFRNILYPVAPEAVVQLSVNQVSVTPVAVGAGSCGSPPVFVIISFVLPLEVKLYTPSEEVISQFKLELDPWNT